ncbi:PAS domain-containing sensor histidine kinase [Fodinicurvata sp. EGI_FJ10296]|uniref:PAS domain-containing sensor histidine kinase n=1 Tax=Fodinicurvata sp. EGI_FJ10296 TaxID=3231908 RepID=UPI003456AD49
MSDFEADDNGSDTFPPADIATMALGLCSPVYIAGTDGVIRYSNKAFNDIFRRSDGHPLRRISPRLLSALRRSSAPIRQRESVEIDGRKRTLSGRHVKLAGHGGDTLVGVYDDQTIETELRAALGTVKERSDELLSTVSDWVWQTDTDWTIVHSVTRDIGTDIETCAELTGRSLFDIGQFRPASGRRPPTLRTRAPFRDVLFVLERPAGGERIYLLSGIPVFDAEAGGFQGFRGSGTDVTERLAAEERAGAYRLELEQALTELTATNARLDGALAQARDADRAKSLFLGMIGHELRTPLNAIIGFSEVMSDELFGPIGRPEYKDYAADVLQSGRHLLSIINDILDVVKLEAGEMMVQADRFDPSETISAGIRLLSLQAENKQISLDQDIAEDFPVLFADEQKLRQMIINLLSNAVKFTNKGGRVTISGHRSPQGEAVVTVTDNGIGIDSANIESLLQPFKQADDRLSRSFEGTGLGLPLTRSLIELHGGRLEIDSALGVGTTVRLVFPADRVDPT